MTPCSYGALRRYAADLAPEVALVHLGAVRFGLSGPLRYTMNAKEGASSSRWRSPEVVVPIHVEGWSHFTEQEEAARKLLAAESAIVCGSRALGAAGRADRGGDRALSAPARRRVRVPDGTGAPRRRPGGRR